MSKTFRTYLPGQDLLLPPSLRDRLPHDHLAHHDCVAIINDRSHYDYRRIVEEAQLVLDARNATVGIQSPKIVRC